MTIHKVLVSKLQWFYGKSHIELIFNNYNKKIIELETFFRFFKRKIQIYDSKYTIYCSFKAQIFIDKAEKLYGCN